MLRQEYPAQPEIEDKELGVWPVDFLVETIIEAGLTWFRDTDDAGEQVFGHLRSPWLKSKYGQAKIDEIKAFVEKYQIPIVQHWALIGEQSPCISIQLLDGSEMEARAGLADFERVIDTLGDQNQVNSREEIGYSPISDNIHIGVHAIGTPDMVKYLYYLVVHILNVFKPQLENRGMHLGTFRATDISRLNEYLPQHVFSRFVNFNVFSVASFNKGNVPIIEKIIGVNLKDGPEVTEITADIEYPAGMTLADIEEEQ